MEPTTTTETEVENTSLKWWILATVMVGTLLGRLDQTVVNLALPNSDLSLALRPDRTFSNTSAFAKSTTAFDPRTMQLGLRFIF